jgi:anti-sigma B factor antagonist
MEINTRTENGNYLIWLRGELDASCSILLDDSIRDGLDKNPLSICIDCTDLCYISSAGLGVFISHLQDLQDKSVPLVLFALREPVENVFQVLGLDSLIPIMPDREHAIRYCRTQLC